MKFRISNGVDWDEEFTANHPDELKKRVKQSCLKFRKLELQKLVSRWYGIEIQFYKNEAWLNSNNSNFPPKLDLKTYLPIGDTFVNIFNKSHHYGSKYDEISQICVFATEYDQLKLLTK